MNSTRILEGLQKKALDRGMPPAWCLLVAIRLSREHSYEACWLSERELYLCRDMIYAGRLDDRLVFETGVVNRRDRASEEA